jgi:hypothetical protein
MQYAIDPASALVNRSMGQGFGRGRYRSFGDDEVLFQIESGDETVMFASELGLAAGLRSADKEGGFTAAKADVAVGQAVIPTRVLPGESETIEDGPTGIQFGDDFRIYRRSRRVIEAILDDAFSVLFLIHL